MAEATEFSPLGALDIAGLQDGFRGELLRPEDPGYEDARRVWNGSINRFPVLIARCAGVADVIAAVRFAKDSGLLIAAWWWDQLVTSQVRSRYRPTSLGGSDHC